jgi:hypothetical protein
MRNQSASPPFPCHLTTRGGLFLVELPRLCPSADLVEVGARLRLSKIGPRFWPAVDVLEGV